MQSPILSRSASDQPSPEEQLSSAPLQHNHELGSALEHGLGLPLSALRASIESLQLRTPEGTQEERSLNGALKKVALISRNIHDLMDLAVPPSVLPSHCTPESIAVSARGSLAVELQARVLVANMAAATSVHMDAPLVTRCLRRLIDNALEAGSEVVLLTLRSEANSTSFTVVDAGASSFDSHWAMEAFHSNKRHHMGIGLSLVARDMELLNGELLLDSAASGETIATLRLPNAPEQRPNTGVQA